MVLIIRFMFFIFEQQLDLCISNDYVFGLLVVAAINVVKIMILTMIGRGTKIATRIYPKGLWLARQIVRMIGRNGRERG